MYKKMKVIESFMKEDLDALPSSNIIVLANHKELEALRGWIETLEGKFNGRQLRFKKPYVVTERTKGSGMEYAVWTNLT